MRRVQVLLRYGFCLQRIDPLEGDPLQYFAATSSQMGSGAPEQGIGSALEESRFATDVQS